MKTLTISDDLKRLCPAIAVGCLEYKATVSNCSPLIWAEITRLAEDVKNKFTVDKLSAQPKIAAYRRVYRALGKDPTRYRVSSEALVRRILQSKALYQVNNIVDFNNLISIKSLFSLGSFDRRKIEGDILFRVGRKEEIYAGIGRDLINIEGLPVFSDDKGAFGSLTSDSERTKITADTEEFLTLIISFSGKEELYETMKDATDILRDQIGARNIESRIVS